jgi:hypothetical protein
MKATIEDMESRLERDLFPVLKSVIPKGYRPRVALVDKKLRRKRKDASAAFWSPASGEIRISFEPETSSVVSTLSAGFTESEFQPVKIRGERLSTTILRDRR